MLRETHSVFKRNIEIEAVSRFPQPWAILLRSCQSPTVGTKEFFQQKYCFVSALTVQVSAVIGLYFMISKVLCSLLLTPFQLPLICLSPTFTSCGPDSYFIWPFNISAKFKNWEISKKTLVVCFVCFIWFCFGLFSLKTWSTTLGTTWPTFAKGLAGGCSPHHSLVSHWSQGHQLPPPSRSHVVVFFLVEKNYLSLLK